MSRMHSSKKGKSRSKLPFRLESPAWVEFRDKKAEEIAIKVAKQGHTMSYTGLILRDHYGIPRIKLMTNKKMGQIYKESKLLPQIPEDLIALMRKAVNLNKHLKNNPKDMSNKRGLILIEAKIKRLSDYYKQKNRIPKTWKYSIDTAEVLTK
jgi:small subunit ribosomal protein S15